MQKLSKYTTKSILLFGVIISLCASIIGVYGSKMITSQNNAVRVCGLFMSVALLAIIVYCVCSLCSNVKSAYKNEKTKLSILDLIVCGTFFSVFALLISILNGVLANGIYLLLAKLMSFSQIKTIIEVVGSLITVFTFPFLTNAILRIIVGDKTTFGEIISGFKMKKRKFFKYVFFYIFVIAIGYFMVWISKSIINNIISELITVLMSAVVGMVAVPSVMCIYDSE